MPTRFRVGFAMTALAVTVIGCGSTTPTPTPSDSGVDVTTDVPTPTDVTDTGDTGGGCPSIVFVRPTADQVLGAADNLSHDCSTGFTYNVQVAVNAAPGTSLELLVGGRVAGTATVSGPTATFSNVSLDTHATSMLGVRVAGTTTTCATESVTTLCATPRCTILRPDHSTLTTADNTRMGGGFATDFVVGTDIADGQPVSLTLSDRPDPIQVTAAGGMATFPAVMFAGDGDYRVQAQCTDRAGNVGRSTSTVYTVAATPPTLGITSPMAGAVVGLSTDVDMRAGLQFNVCAHSNAAGQQLCAAVASGMPDSPQGCGTVPASATTDVCVQVTCPTGAAPFDVQVTTQDTHGNVAHATLAGVRCQSALPSVRIVAPAALMAGDATTYLNASRDLDPATPGLQVNVTACVDRTAGMATLFANGTAVGTPVAVAAAAAGDPCAALGMGFVGTAVFTGITLPDTTPEVTDPAQIAGITTPQLRVDVRDPTGDVGQSASQVEYVDSAAPSVTITTPGCGALLVTATGASSVAQDVTVDSGRVFPVDLTIHHPDGRIETRRATAAGTATGQARFAAVTFETGDSTLSATVTDPAGSVGTSTPGCTVHVGNPPRVTFTTPTDGQVFSTVGDTAPGTPGYQSVPVTVTTDAPAGTVLTLTVPGNPPVTATATASGTVSFGPQSLPEGSYAVTVTTAAVTGRGMGMAAVRVVVDTQAPTGPGAITATLTSRRGGVAQLAFTDGADPNPAGGTRAVTRYEVRYSTIPITATNYLLAPVAPVTVTPGAPGAANTVSLPGLRLGNSYYFAIRAIDAAGNGTALASIPVTASPGLSVNVTSDVFTDVAITGLGSQVTGGFDLNGDSFADVVVATTLGQVRVYFGSATGLSATRYALISDSSSTGFGSAAASIGDFNGDGVGDIAVGAPRAGGGAGAVYVYLGRAGHGTGVAARTWPALPAGLTATDADLTVTADATADFAGSLLGVLVSRIGDFNCDGIADLGFSAPLSGTGATTTRPGTVMVVFGRATVPATLNAPSGASVVINNTAADQTLLGQPVTGGGFLVGSDRCEDLLIGTHGVADRTIIRVNVIAGRTVASPPLMLTTADAAFSTTGPSTYQALPAAGIGDFNGDGQSDFAVGALGNATVPANPGTNGQVSVFLGNGAGAFTQVTFAGTVNTLGFGYALAGIWDPTVVHPSLLVPASTAADLVAGMDSWQGGAPRVEAWSGRASPAGLTPDVPDTYYNAVGTGSASPTSSVNWLGDVDHDGYPDLGIGQPNQKTFILVH